jgi:hypothetical protein
MKLRYLLLIPTLLTALSLQLANPSKASALSGSSFNAGRIIDDAIFTNKDSMTITQIQAFLNAKVPVCQTWHSAYNAQNPPPYTCLKDYQEGGKSAAQIIWEASQTYNINPQTMIVLLQKEQALVTDDWPLVSQYTKATGYLCPDTAPCSAAAGGFSKQVFGAAWQFRNDLNGIDTPGFISFYGKGWNNILYSPNAACGTKRVYIENQATAVLYKYTPYTPNQSALDNLYGSGDSCGAYGNRNFWRLFNDWFGSTAVAAYDYQFVSSSYSVLQLDNGQETTSNIIIKNVGNNPWYADGSLAPGQRPTRLSMLNYGNTTFADTSDPNWLGTRNQIKMTPAVVNPGENATFTFKITAPYAKIDPTTITFVPVVDGIGFMRNSNMQFILSSNTPRYSYVSAMVPPPSILSNKKFTANLVIKNSGNGPWHADGNIPTGKHPIRLVGLYYANNPFADTSDPNWLGTRNQIKMTPAVVNPGENATFTFSFTGTSAQSTFNFRFLPVLDGVSMMADYGMAFYLSTPGAYYSYQFSSVSGPPQSMVPGSSATATLQLKNTGTLAWKNEKTRTPSQPALRLVMTKPWYRSSAFYDDSSGSKWLVPSQIAMTSENVEPGEVGTFTFSWKAPTKPGTYIEYFAPVVDGVTLLHDINMGFLVKVQ